MWPFTRKKSIDHDLLIARLEKGSDQDILDLLWQPPSELVAYLPVTINVLRKFQKIDAEDTTLSIERTQRKGDFELVIFRLASEAQNVSHSPLILHVPTERVVGVILPFNELHGHLSGAASRMISELGMIWIAFNLAQRTGQAGISSS